MLATQTLTLGAGHTVFGCGAIERLPSLVASLGYDRAFVVTDSGVTGAGIARRVEHLLADAGIRSATFDDIHPNPGTQTLDAGADAARAFGQAAVVAVGGGSVIDAAKGLALMATNPGDASQFDYRNEPGLPGSPIIAIPTTAGTGAETNGFGVIDNPTTGRKFYVGHASVVPKAVILDPELTIGLPASATAATGMDVLTHSLESLSARQSNPYADGLNLQVISMVTQHLPRAVADGSDIEARSQMLLAAHMAALAFATTGLGMGHAVAHALSARTGVAHGVALSVLLGHVLTFNLPVRAEVYALVAAAMQRGMDRPETVDAAGAIDAVRALAVELGIPATLSQLRVPESALDQIVEDALADEVMLNTPRLPTVSELRALLHRAMGAP
jgi:alcohol dehydrogenase class IV